MKYIAQAFVHITDKDERITVFESLKYLGYDVYEYYDVDFDPAQQNLVREVNSHNELFVIDKGFLCFGHEAEDTDYAGVGFIDCRHFAISHKEAIALFLKLAKMRSDIPTWLVNNSGTKSLVYGVDREQVSNKYTYSYNGGLRPLAPQELSELVRAGELKL